MFAGLLKLCIHHESLPQPGSGKRGSVRMSSSFAVRKQAIRKRTAHPDQRALRLLIIASSPVYPHRSSPDARARGNPEFYPR